MEFTILLYGADYVIWGRYFEEKLKGCNSRLKLARFERMKADNKAHDTIKLEGEKVSTRELRNL